MNLGLHHFGGLFCLFAFSFDFAQHYRLHRTASLKGPECLFGFTDEEIVGQVHCLG